MKKVLLAIGISAAAFFLVLNLIAQLWAAIFYTPVSRFNAISIFR